MVKVNMRFPRLFTVNPGHHAGLLLLLIVALFMLGGASYQWARADGGFPTATPTITPTPSPTFTFTPPPPTPTFTPTATLPVVTPILEATVDIIPPVLDVTQTPPLGLPTEPPPEGRPAALFCWPFALAFILIVIIVGSILFGRNRINGSLPPPPP